VKRDEGIGGWRKLHNEKLHNFTKGGLGHVECMGWRGIHIGFWWEGQKETDD
jgi:hypothetical protein